MRKPPPEKTSPLQIMNGFSPDNLLPPEIIEELRYGAVQVTFLPMLVENYKAFTQALDTVNEHCYAVKANSSPEVILTLFHMGASFDVSNVGELKILQELKISGNKIIWSNTSKNDVAVEEALDYGITRFVCHSTQDVKRIRQVIDELNSLPGREKRQIDPGSIEIIARVKAEPGEQAVFGHKVRFGMEEEPQPVIPGLEIEDLRGFLENVKNEGLKVAGIHLHHGSQNPDMSAWDKTLERMLPVFDEMRALYPEMDTINLSGGYATPLNFDPDAIAQSAKQLNEAIKRQLGERLGVKILTEPGRIITATTSLIIAQVEEIVAQRDPHEKQQGRSLQITSAAGRNSAGLDEPGVVVLFAIGDKNGNDLEIVNRPIGFYDPLLPQSEEVGKYQASFYDFSSGAFAAAVGDWKGSKYATDVPASLKTVFESGRKVIVMFINTGAYVDGLRNHFNGQTQPYDLVVRDVYDPNQRMGDHHHIKGELVNKSPRYEMRVSAGQEPAQLELRRKLRENRARRRDGFADAIRSEGSGEDGPEMPPSKPVGSTRL